MWKQVNDRQLLVLVACSFVLLTLHVASFEASKADCVEDMRPGDRAELLCVVDERWSTEKGTMLWISDMRGESIRVFADERIDVPEEGELTLLTARMSDDRGILFAEGFRSPL